MNPENNNQPNVDTNQQPASQPSVPPLKLGGKKVIQPSESIKQELKAQQQIPQSVVQSNINSQQAQTSAPNPANVYPEPTSAQVQVGMSASQLGLHEPKSKLLDIFPKQLIIKVVIGLVILSGIFTALVMTNIVALSEFKTVSYNNSKGDNYSLKFYSKHSSKETKSGTKQLVSKVSKDEKFPLNLSISAGNNGLNGYTRLKDCASFSKVYDVHNSNLNQKISICNAISGGVSGQSAKGKVYIAGFTHNDKVHIVTISQDYSGVDLSSQSGAQQSLTKFGLDAYDEDIKTIVSSIKIE